MLALYCMVLENCFKKAKRPFDTCPNTYAAFVLLAVKLTVVTKRGDQEEEEEMGILAG